MCFWRTVLYSFKWFIHEIVVLFEKKPIKIMPNRTKNDWLLKLKDKDSGILVVSKDQFVKIIHHLRN